MKTLLITVEMLDAKGACMSGMRDFLGKFKKETHPDGVDYQVLLDACAENGRDDYAEWLLSVFGSIDATLEVDTLESDKSIFFAGSIICRGEISCKRRIRAGKGIKAGLGIKAGWGIEAGEGIKAGFDFGIYAGLGIRVSQKEERATIVAKEEPRNIVCGRFVRKESEAVPE